MTKEAAVAAIDIKKALVLGGWMSFRELTWLATAASECKRIVEFGCYHGRSTRALADNSPEDATIWAVDPWNGEYYTEDGSILADVNSYCYPQFRLNLKDHIDSGKVIPVRRKSQSFTLHEKVDMVFIDGDHRYNAVFSDILTAKNLLKDGGILCGHDYGHKLWTGVELAVTDLIGKVEVEDTIWFTRKF